MLLIVEKVITKIVNNINVKFVKIHVILVPIKLIVFLAKIIYTYLNLIVFQNVKMDIIYRINNVNPV